MKRKLNLGLILLFCLGLFFNSYGQTKEEKAKILKQTKVEYLLDYAKEKSKKYQANKAKAIELAKEKGWIISKQIEGGGYMELQGVTEDGRPLYYITHNANAAVTTSTDKVYSGGGLGLDLDGTGMTAGEWDGGDVLTTHQEFNNTGSSRVTDKDGVSSTHPHATHVAGTIMAGGVQVAAKGMAYNANLDAYDWDDDESEMAVAAAAGLLISNHSYGYSTGWTWTGSSYVWYGDASISNEEAYQFGFYSDYCAEIDDIASNAPNYLIVKSAGNDRGEWDGSSTLHPQDGGADGYDCISHKGNAKNVLTVGSVNDIIGGYTQPSDVTLASSSSTGPCDDSRIKPDIVGNGINLYSSVDNNNTSYDSYSGTSMASPNVTGSLLLLQEHYNESFGSFMKAATLKALAIHTADECGPNEGPDYKFGWGLLNTGEAANVITERYVNSYINEETYTGSAYTLDVEALGTEPLVVTIVWSDPAGTPVAPALDPTDIMLVNDLDMTITGTGGPYYPYMLSAASPASAATKGDNDVDNVEKIYIASPTAGTYTINITHEGSITGGTQDFSIIVTGVDVTSEKPIVTTTIPNTITETTAQSGGNVINEGVASVTERGVVWSTTENPTTSDNKVIDGGTGEGTYVSTINTLTAATTYHVRAFATSTSGTSYGDDLSFTTTCTPPATQASGIASPVINDNDITLTWISGGDHVLIIAKEGSAVDVDPFRGEIYAVNSDFTLGEDLNFGNIAVYSGTDETISITGLSEATEYHFAIYKYNNAEKCYNITSPATATVTTTGYCSASATTCEEYISRVQLNTIDNSSACDVQDYTSISTDLLQESSYNLEVTNGSPYTGDVMGCWIDWNQDKDFDDENEEITISYTAPTGTATIEVPYDAEVGATRMRIRVQYQGTPVACGNTSYGEVEEYSLNIIEPVRYAVNFTVKDNSDNFIEGAKILINSRQQITNSNGESTYNLTVGTHSYKVTATDFYMETGEVEVVDADVNLDIIMLSTSIEDDILNSNDFNIYPNPSSGVIKIQGERLTNARISLYDIVGKQLMNKVSENSQISLDISEFSNGIYIIHIDTGDKIYKQKLLKE
jgi:hypothetical protein